METQQLNGYKIEFYTEEEWNKPIGEVNNKPWRFGEDKQYAVALPPDDDSGIIESNYQYAGLTSDIPEELAEKVVESTSWYGNSKHYKCYNHSGGLQDYLKLMDTAKQSFQTLSDLPYCVITKIVNNT